MDPHVSGPELSHWDALILTSYIVQVIMLISIASEISKRLLGFSGGKVAQLPVQATNCTSEDLTLTILAPASFTSPPTVVSLNSSPASHSRVPLGSRNEGVGEEVPKVEEGIHEIGDHLDARSESAIIGIPYNVKSLKNM
ncbi:hypothetical protein QQ045_006455 [Rhodiola kirilowii]